MDRGDGRNVGSILETFTNLPLTMIDSFHGNPCCILAVAFLVQLHHGVPIMLLSWVQGIEFAGVSSQLLYGTGTECITRCDQHTESVLHQPEAHLEIQYFPNYYTLLV